MLIKLFSKTTYGCLFNDAPTPWQLGFQEVATPTMEGIVELLIMWLCVCMTLLNLSIYWKVNISPSINYKQVGYIEQSVGNINSLLRSQWNLRDYMTETKQIDSCTSKVKTPPLQSCVDNYNLVKYGSNNSTWISYMKLNNLTKNYLVFTERTQSVLIGLMLSDGFIGKLNNRSKNCRFRLTQSLDHIDFIYFSFKELAIYCSSLPYLHIRTNKLGKTLVSVTLQTRSLPIFNESRAALYSNGKHRIPMNLFDYFNPTVLAYWIMGDGAQISRKQGGLILCTDSFSIKEVVYLMNVMLVKYDLETTLKMHDNKPRIYIKRKSFKLLSNLVSKEISPNMMYKLGIYM
jgi:hypothetical protein